MADAVVRLKVESQEYDQKLQRATQQLQHMEKEVRRTGATFAYADKEELAFVQSLGSMETKAESAKGKIAEMTKTFTELSLQYNRLTKEEKNSPFGKGLAQSLEQLKGRIKDSKSELSKVEGSLNGFGDIAKQAAGKLGLPVEQLAKFGPYGAAAAAALKVAKDAFMNMESGIDEWGRTVEGAKSAYSIFLDTLNGGNWSSFFTNLGNAISGARKLYDEMDRLGSIKANNAAAIAKEQATIQELRLRQQKGENVANELRDAEERLRKLQSQSVEQGKKAGAMTISETITNRANAIALKGDNAFKKDKTVVDEAAINEAVKDILEHGQDAFDKYAEQMATLKEKARVEHYDVYKGETWSSYNYDKLSEEEKKQLKLAMAITEAETKIQDGINIYAQAVQEGTSSAREATAVEKAANRGASSADKNLTPQEKAEKQVKEALERYTTAINVAAIYKETGLTDEKKYKEQELQSRKALFDAYAQAYNIYASPELKDSMDEQVTAIQALTKELEDLADAEAAAKKAASELEKAQKDEAAKLKDKDSGTLGDLAKYASQAGLSPSSIGLDKIQATIEAGIEVSDDDWQKAIDTVNLYRQAMMLDPIEINFETGNIEEVKNQVEEAFKVVKNIATTGTSAFSDLIGGMDSLKSVGEDLASVFKGEKDAWDSMMTVMQSGITIIETVISITEALNTLKKVGIAIDAASTLAKEQKNKTEEEGTIATIASTIATNQQTTADIKEAGTAGVAAGANAAEGATKAGKSVAGIPIVGPILAVAAIAAVMGAMIAAMSKTKSAGNFSTGGIVPGNSYSGDNLNIGVNSQELVLNRAQTSNLASQLNSNPMGNLRLSTEISGSNLRMVLNNDNRSRGGSRDVYGVR